MSIHLTILDQASGTRADSAWLRRRLHKLLRLLKVRHGDWSITIVRDAAMSVLHQRTLNIRGTTDVLTFDLQTTNQTRTMNHDLDLDTIICRDEAARRAAELGHPIRHELLLYALHSLLHVQGYDDRTAAAARRMHRREDQLLTQLDVGPVFAVSKRSAKGSRP